MMSLDQRPLPAAAVAVRDRAAKHAARSQETRRLDPEVTAEIVTAGFARHLVPAGRGGAEGGFRALVDALVVVGQGSAEAAWIAGLSATVARMAAYLPAGGQAEVWAHGPDALVVGGLMPAGTARPVTGGYRISGRWPYMSGVEASDWAFLCATVPAPDGSRSARYLAVPRADYAIEDTWFTVGMRGTGSNTLIVDDVHVPERLTCPREAIWAGAAPGSEAPCHQVPLHAVNGLGFAATAVGAGRGLLAAWTDHMTARARDGRPGPAAHADPDVQQVLARSEGELDAAELLLQRAGDLVDAGGLAPLEAARNARDAALAAELAAGAVNRLFLAGGTRAQSEGTAMERAWRDVNAAVTHLALQFRPAAARYAGEVLAPA